MSIGGVGYFISHQVKICYNSQFDEDHHHLFRLQRSYEQKICRAALFKVSPVIVDRPGAREPL